MVSGIVRVSAWEAPVSLMRARGSRGRNHPLPEMSYDWRETVTREANIKVGFVVFKAVTGKYCPGMWCRVVP
jgi:hypothetical protein